LIKKSDCSGREPGLGYAKDPFASAHLESNHPAVFAEYKVVKPSGWLLFRDLAALDGRNLGEVQAKLATAREKMAGGWFSRPAPSP